jgi:ABC-type uncharacterized transport system substrate-binding protein
VWNVVARIGFTGCAGAALLSASLEAGDRGYDAVVAFRSGSEAYQQAIEGMREVLRETPLRVQYVDLVAAGGAAELAAARAAASGSGQGGAPRLMTIVGAGAWESADEGLPYILPALMLRQEVKAHGVRRAGAVYADVPLARVSEGLRAVFPGKSRLGLIHRPSVAGPDAAAIARLRQMGFDLHVVECASPDGLLAAFASLRGKADFAITEPDAELYNSATVKPLVRASLEQRLPIVGFSAAFVRAGALVGVYPDFHELGRQTGQLAERILTGKIEGNRTEEEVRKVVVAVNQTMARLLGMSPAAQAETVLFK